MTVQCAVNEVVCIPEFTHGTGLQKWMSLIGSPRGFFCARNPDIFRPGQDGKHIGRIQFKAHGTVFCRFGAIQQNGISGQRKAGIKVKPSVVVHKNPRVKLKRLILFPNGCSVIIFYITIELIFSCRFIADCYGNHLRSAHKVVQIKSSVRPLYHIRGCQPIGQTDTGRCRILLSFEDYTLIPPVSQIIHRCGPAHVVSKTKIQSVKNIMGTIYIHPVSYHMGLGIRNIFPAWHIWIKCLFRLHLPSSLNHNPKI